MRHDLVRHCAWLDLTRPTDHRRDPESAFPVGVLFVAERGHCGIWPGIHVRAVVCAVEYDRVVRHTELIDLLQHGPDVLVVIDHDVMIYVLPAASLTDTRGLRMRAEMHVSEVYPAEKRFAGLGLLIDEGCGTIRDVVVNRLHALPGERSGILDLLLSNAAEARVGGRVVHVARKAVNDAARTKAFAEVRKILGVRIIRKFRFFLGIQVVQVAIELVEPVYCRQKLVTVTRWFLPNWPVA